MSESQALLSRVAALRQDRENPAGPEMLAHDALLPNADPSARLSALQRQLTAGHRQAAAAERLVKLASGSAPASEEPGTLPRQFTVRTRRLLERGRQLLDDLRLLAQEPLVADEAHPLNGQYTEAAAMAEVAVRMLQALPDSPSGQLRLCAGLEGILDVVAERVQELSTVLARVKRERETLDALATLLSELHGQETLRLESLLAVAEAVTEEARRDEPLRFLDPHGDDAGHRVACHALTAARVAARLARSDPAFRGRTLEVVLAALVQDVAMLGVPPEVLACEGPLDEDQRRQIELHPLAGALLLRNALDRSYAWLAEAAGAHHERLDGTGYPAGLRGLQVPQLARLLAVADVYAALVCARPHRPAFDTRAALTQILRLADRGLLDETFAARLLELTFYPVGTAVELEDGSLGIVAATHPSRPGLQALARPVLKLLLAVDGRPLADARCVDLAHAPSAIARGLTPQERRRRLGPWYAEWAW